MGVCNCNQNKNGIITSEMSLHGDGKNNSNQISNFQNTDNPSLTLTTKKSAIEEDPSKKSQIQKNLIKFTYLNNQSTLASAIKEMNQNIDPRKHFSKRLSLTPQIISYDDDHKPKPLTMLFNLTGNQNSQKTNNTSTSGVPHEEIKKNVSKTPVLLGRSRTNFMGVNADGNKPLGTKPRGLLSPHKGEPSSNNYNYSTAVQEITEEEDLLLNQWIKKHYLFNQFNDKSIQRIIESLSLYQIEEDKFIFKEGETGNEFYIIKSGKLEIKTKITNIVLTQGDTFGELALLKRRCFRTYAALTKTQVEIFSLTMENYNKILKENESSNNKPKPNIKKEQIMKEVTNHPLLKNLSETQKDNLNLMATYHTVTKATLLLTNKKTKKKDSQKPFITNPKALIFPIEGEIVETFKSPLSTRVISKGNGAGFYILYLKFMITVNIMFHLNKKNVLLFYYLRMH